MKTSAQNPIDDHGEGIDGVGSVRLEQESQDLAKQDGRAEARAPDRTLAFQELTAPEGNLAQEVPAGAEGLVTWDADPEESGHLTREIPAEDEADVSAELAEEGRGEAEEDLRRAVEAETRPHHVSPSPG
jgi:hypothetical protein